jgi:hypothetical protein
MAKKQGRARSAAPAITVNRELPAGVLKADLQYRKWNPRKKYESPVSFELWFTERFGWVIPTLFIRGARRADQQRRTYGVAVNGGEVVTVGLGPHVLETLTVYVYNDRRKALQQYLDLKVSGEGKAGEIRDRISTRRARTIARGSYGGW